MDASGRAGWTGTPAALERSVAFFAGGALPAPFFAGLAILTTRNALAALPALSVTTIVIR